MPRRLRVLAQMAWLAAALVVGLAITSPATASAPAPKKATAKFEVDFLTARIDHHAMALEMGEVCLDKAIHLELRAMCQNVVTVQGEEIATMRSWLADWYSVSYQPEMKPGEMRQLERLAALSGAEFEIRFMESLIRHHRKAIVTAEGCVDRAHHADLRELCQGIIETQSAEIAQLENWLCQWYGRSTPLAAASGVGGAQRCRPSNELVRSGMALSSNYLPLEIGPLRSCCVHGQRENPAVGLVGGG
jgi:uncharacterized protein (DUF305 family)